MVLQRRSKRISYSEAAWALGSSLSAGAFHGAVVWGIYGIVEFVFLHLAPFVREPRNAVFSQWHWFVSAVSLVTYIAVGISLGLAAGVIAWLASQAPSFRSDANQGHLLQGLVTIPLLAAFLGQFAIRNPGSSFAQFCLALGALLVLAAVMNSIPRLRFAPVPILASPWSVTIILLGLPWLWEVSISDSPLRTDVACLAAFLLLLGTAWYASACLRLTSRSSGPAWPVRCAVSACVGAALFAATGVVVSNVVKPLASESRGSSSPGRPDVVLIVMDTVRGDHTTLNGYHRDTTPGLRKLAAQSAVYANSVATSNFTLPTHASLFTGLYPRRHEAMRESPVVPSPTPLGNGFFTLAEILSGQGYATGAVSANSAFVNPDFGLAQGFQTFRVHELLPPPYYLQRGVRWLLRPIDSPELTRRYQSAEGINADVYPMLEGLAKSKEPFFLFVNYMDAHPPLLPPARYRDLYPRRVRNFDWPAYRALSLRLQRTHRRFTEEEAEAVAALYDGAIAYIDSQIAELVERLKRLGRFENTLLIITADHGEGLGDHGLMGHGVGTYQHQVGVPLLIKYPRHHAPVRVNEVVSQVDVMPTVLDVLGYQAPSKLDGLSLLRPVNDGRSVVAVSVPANFDYETGLDAKPQHAVVRRTKKLIVPAEGNLRLYDFARDPLEQNNIAAAEPSTTKSLLAFLDRWLASTPKKSGDRIKADEAALERLRALGYIR